MVQASNFLVAIDDGHGMETAGKRTPYIPELGKFLHENEFNRAVAKFLDIELRRIGFKTLLVAPTDKDTPLQDRTRLANSKGASIFVSIHYDAFDGKFDANDPEGITVFYHPNSVQGQRLANAVSKYLRQGTKQQNRGVKARDNLHVLTATNMPAILTENGFMDNKREALLMVSEAFQKEVAKEHAQGICEYFGVSYKSEVAPVAPNKKDYENHWAEKEIGQAMKSGVIKGYDDGNFKPENPITRAQMAVILSRLGLTK